MSATLEKPNPFIEKASKQKLNPFIEKQRRADLEVEELQQIYKIPDTPEGMLELLKSLSDEELEDLVKAQQDLERRLRESGPQNDDELHSWIKNELGINIPREPVCEDHDAPFTFISDLYFERVDAALAMANRGGGKTLLVAVLHWINSLFKPGCESCTFGATEAQSLRCYAHLKNWIYDDQGEKKKEIVSSLMRETVFRNDSTVEVLPGTPVAVNGPHPQKAHADEIEQMDDGTWRESRNMTMSKTLSDGTVIKPQDIGTSTRKGPNGRMQALIDEITDAINHGYKPPRKLYQWCIKETAACVSNCQVANPELPEGEKCGCHLIRKGEWPDTGDGRPKPRLLRDICQGDFARSKGWQPFGDVIKQFLENDSETFEVQQLCLKPEMKFHYLPKFSEERHCIRNFIPDPLNGPIFQAVDWGGTNPHAVNWYQLLKFEVVVQCWVQSHPDKIYSKRLPEGSIICFDEIYKAEIGNDRLAQMVKLKEAMWRREFQGWNVKERFADPQGKAARLDWRQAGLRTSWHVTREFEEHIKVITDLFDANLFFVDGDKCPMWVREAKEWRRNPNTGQQLDIFNHCMSNFRYAVANIQKLHKREASKLAEDIPDGVPIHRESQVTITTRKEGSGPLGFAPSGGQDQFALWRQRLGQPVRQSN